MSHSNNVIKLNEIIGMKVLNHEQERLGQITEIVLNKSSGRVAYLVVSTENLISKTTKLFAVPWHAVHYDPTNSCFLINIDKDFIQNANGFDKDYWPDDSDKVFFKIAEYDTTS